MIMEKDKTAKKRLLIMYHLQKSLNRKRGNKFITNGFELIKRRPIEDLEFAVRKSIRYHTKRRRFFDRLHSGVVFITVLTSSGAFLALMSRESKVAEIFAAITPIISFLDIAYDFSGKSVMYDRLQKRFSNLLIRIIEVKPSLDSSHELEVEQLTIEQDEPPTLKALAIMCYNEQAFAENLSPIYKIPCIQTLLINFISFDYWRPKVISENKFDCNLGLFFALISPVFIIMAILLLQLYG